MKLTLKILAVGVLLIIPFGVVNAQEVQDGGGFTIPNPIDCGNNPKIPPLQDCLAKIIQGLIIIAVPITVVMVVVAAYQFLTSSGQPEKISVAKKTIIYAAVGFAVILLAQAIVFVLRDLVGGGGGATNNESSDSCPIDPPNDLVCPTGESVFCDSGDWVCSDGNA